MVTLKFDGQTVGNFGFELSKGDRLVKMGYEIQGQTGRIGL